MRRRADIDRVFQHGRHNSGKLIAIRSVPNEVGHTRFAYSVSRRVGKAVVRNRVRRRLREIVRVLPVHEGYDIMFSTRPAAAEAGFGALRDEISLLLKRARLVAAP